METYIPTEARFKELIKEAFEELSVVKSQSTAKAPNKQWLTRTELKELTGWSDRTLQHLRDSRQIPFSQHGRKILYPTDGIYKFLEENRVEVRGE